MWIKLLSFLATREAHNIQHNLTNGAKLVLTLGSCCCLCSFPITTRAPFIQVVTVVLLLLHQRRALRTGNLYIPLQLPYWLSGAVHLLIHLRRRTMANVKGSFCHGPENEGA